MINSLNSSTSTTAFKSLIVSKEKDSSGLTSASALRRSLKHSNLGSISYLSDMYKNNTAFMISLNHSPKGGVKKYLNEHQVRENFKKEEKIADALESKGYIVQRKCDDKEFMDISLMQSIVAEVDDITRGEAI